jgi:hypothetical protein
LTVAYQKPGESKDDLAASVDLALQAICREFLRAGLGERAFCSAARRCFIAAAAQELQNAHAKVTVSAIAALTGVPRRHVASVISGMAAAKRSAGGIKPQPTLRVLSRWRSDPKYQTKRGLPRVLPLDGRVGSFQDLVKEAGGDVTPSAVMRELIRFDAAEKIGQKSIRLVAEGIAGPGYTGAALRDFSTLVADFTEAASTVIVGRNHQALSHLRTGFVSDAKTAARFRRAFSSRATALVESFASWNLQSGAADGTTLKHRVGVGVYLIDQPPLPSGASVKTPNVAGRKKETKPSPRRPRAKRA